MTLRSLVWLAAFAYTIFIGGGLVCYQLFVVHPPIKASALAKHQNDIKAIQTTLSNEQSSFLRINMDWSKWDDSYSFVRQRNNKYISRNINSPSFSDVNIDSVIFLDIQGDTVYWTEKVDKKFVPKDSASKLNADMNRQGLISQDKQFSFIRRNGKLGYFAAHHVQDSLEENKPNGILIFIREMNENLIKRLNLIANVTFEITPSNEEKSPCESPLSTFSINNIANQYETCLLNHHGKQIAKMLISYPDSSIPRPLDSTSFVSILVVILLPITLTLLVNNFYLIPISRMFSKIGEMKKSGDLECLEHRSNIVEIDGFRQTFNHLVEQINAQKEQLIEDSLTDGLTHIYNRKYFDQAFDELWRSAARSHDPISIVMIDIDYFKKYNDHYGHQKGDEVLKLIADTLNQASRRANDILARYGGEEFVLIVKPKSMPQLREILNKLIESVRQLEIEHAKSSTSHFVTISCGACFIAKGGDWMKSKKETALVLADEALYQAKANGRNQCYAQSFFA